jgi:tripartite-type tricarboxylate transporter receptor subunit TctC
MRLVNYFSYWPRSNFLNKPIEINVWPSAGVGTDVTNRLNLEIMKKYLCHSIFVSNRTCRGDNLAINYLSLVMVILGFSSGYALKSN